MTTSLLDVGTTPPTHVAVLFQRPPDAVDVIVCAMEFCCAMNRINTPRESIHRNELLIETSMLKWWGKDYQSYYSAPIVLQRIEREQDDPERTCGIMPDSSPGCSRFLRCENIGVKLCTFLLSVKQFWDHVSSSTISERVITHIIIRDEDERSVLVSSFVFLSGSSPPRCGLSVLRRVFRFPAQNKEETWEISYSIKYQRRETSLESLHSINDIDPG